jgi:glycolate oxidase iron-sulfur subunit
VKLKTLGTVKITPKLLLNFIQLPFKKVEKPCIYCPGICISACPTFINTGNLSLSPLGYSRYEDLGRNNCLKCWRCVSECPLSYPLPESYASEVKLDLEVLKKGEIVLLSARKLDDKYSFGLSELLGTGLISINGLVERYDEGRPVNPSSLKRILRALKNYRKVYTISPEPHHTLSVPLLIENLAGFSIRLNYNGPIHVPCLLLNREEKIIQSLISIGVRPTKIIRDQCLKMEEPEGLSLCPRASMRNVKTIFDEILASLSY